MKYGTLLQELSEARTLSGREIFKLTTHSENHLRSRVSVLSWEVVSFLDGQDLPDAVVRESVEKLRAAFADPTYYGENRPGSVFGNGMPTVDDPRFDYADFIGFAMSAEESFEAFQRRLGLNRRITYRILIGLIALLLIDSAMERVDQGDAFGGAAELLHAADAREEMFHEGRKDFARIGALAKHKKTEQYKSELLREWDAGKFKTKVAAKNWATKIKKWPVNPEVVARWIREHLRLKE